MDTKEFKLAEIKHPIGIENLEGKLNDRNVNLKSFFEGKSNSIQYVNLLARGKAQSLNLLHSEMDAILTSTDGLIVEKPAQ